jgi:hypothetical protein
LSKDILTRVKNSIYFNNSNNYLSAATSEDTCLLGIESDCGVYFVQRSTIGISSTVKVAAKRSRGCQSRKETVTSVLHGIDEGS